jgi:hypothetical protein
VTRSGCAETSVAFADVVVVPEESDVSGGLDDAEVFSVKTELLDAVVTLDELLVLMVVPFMAALETGIEVMIEAVGPLPVLSILADITL